MSFAERLPIRVRSGATVVAQADLSSLTTFVLLEQGDWFEPEIDFVRAFVTPGMRAIDVGANHGVYALAIAAALRGEGRVWAVEPTSRPFALLQAGITASGMAEVVTPLPWGLSDRARDARMAVNRNSEFNSLHADHSAYERVRLETLDRLLQGPLRGERIDFVKLDVEGEEVNVVRGGANFFARQSPLVQFEVRHGCTWNRGLAETFRALGYAIYRLVPGLDLLAPVDVRAGVDPFQLNLFAAKPDRAAELAARGLLVVEHYVDASQVPHLRWESELARRACSRGLEDAQGRATPEVRDRERHAAHGYGLDALFSALEVGADGTRRLGLLKQAVDVWTRLHGSAPGEPAYALCLARCFAALGERAAAVGLLSRLLSTGESAGWRTGLAVVPPLAEQEARAPVMGPASWMQAVVAEGVEVLHTHSSYLAGGLSAGLRACLSNPDLSPAMRRRIRLHAAREGVDSPAWPLPSGAQAGGAEDDSLDTLLASQGAHCADAVEPRDNGTRPSASRARRSVTHS